MSRMEIYRILPQGDVVLHGELRNSWLGSAFVWTQIGDRYLGKYCFEAEQERYNAGGRVGELDYSGWQRSWALQNDPKVAEWDWATLMSTFDGCIIGAEHFEYMARQWELFYEAHKAAGSSHYGELARMLREGLPEGTRGCCFNATSVNQNPWWVMDPEGEGRPYSVDLDKEQSSGREHWWLDPSIRPKLPDVHRHLPDSP